MEWLAIYVPLEAIVRKGLHNRRIVQLENIIRILRSPLLKIAFHVKLAIIAVATIRLLQVSQLESAMLVTSVLKVRSFQIKM